MVKIRLGEPMKQKFLLTISILIVLLISACGSSETPTLSPQDQASTAVAEAWLIITQTQAALPTSTPVPPTSTPEPTLTFLPTIPILATLPPAFTAAPTQDECNQVPPLEPQGSQVNVDFTNQSEGQVNLSLGMNSPNDKKECVTYSFALGSGKGVVDARILSGCYWGYAWITGSEPSVARTGDILLCMTDTSGTYHIVITKETINFK
jgi:hypothetical protein